MIVILKHDHNPSQLDSLMTWLQDKGDRKSTRLNSSHA